MDIDKLKDDIISRVDVAAFYEQHLNGERLPAPKGSGWTERVRCPIHNDQGTPNFFVNIKTGGFKCHRCDASGSIFDFWMIMNGISVDDRPRFKDAMAAVATFAGLDISSWIGENQDASKYAPKKQKDTSSIPQPHDIPKVGVAEDHDSKNLPIDTGVVEALHAALRPEHVKFLLIKRGLKKKTIDDAMIGWDASWPGKDKDTEQWFRGRIVIPVRNPKGEYRNIRGYSSRVDPAFKMANYVINKGKPEEKGYGHPPRLYNADLLSTGNYVNVVICEGEFDAILGNQQLWDAGYTDWLCVTSTHGAKNFMPEWLPLFFGKNVFFCFDVDEEGKMRAPALASKFFLPYIQSKKFLSVHITELPLKGTKEEKDVSDYYLKCGGTADDFVRICNATPELISGGVSNDEATVEVIDVGDLVTALKGRRYIDKKIRVPLTISGTTSRVYHAVRKYKVRRCPLMSDGHCCSQNAGEQIIPYGHPLFIQSCMNKEAANLAAIAAMTCEKHQKGVVIEATCKVVMEEYFAHQVIPRWRAEEKDGKLQNAQELVQTQVYILQPDEHFLIEPKDYYAVGFVRTHPNTSVVTLFIESMEPIEEDWSHFSVQDKSNADLIRRIKDGYTTDQILHSITRDVTHVYEADDILLAVLLTYLSPLSFMFNGRYLRGWLNVAIMGDSGTGKSITYMRLSDWLDLGDLFSSLSGTRTGLLYAIKQRQGEWHVSIGRYVQASRKIIAIDEAQEIHPDELKKMAIAMDVGFLSIEQVASGGYHTQTRTIFLMNPKDGRGGDATITDFSHGCHSLRNSFSPMFIRRLDLAVFTINRHEHSFFNKKHSSSAIDNSPAVLPAMMKALVYYAWTRKPDDVVWSEEATDACLGYATKLSEVYGYASDVPLVSPQDFRLNLARLATSYAILARSFSDDLEQVIVTPQHVIAVANLINTIYSSPACNLKHYSADAKSKNTIDDYLDIKGFILRLLDSAEKHGTSKYKGSDLVLQMILTLERVSPIRKRDLTDQLGASPRWVQSKLAALLKFNLIEASRHGYKRTRKFSLFMMQWRDEPGIVERLDRAYSNVEEQAILEDDPLIGYDQFDGTDTVASGVGDIWDAPPSTFDSPFDDND